MSKRNERIQVTMTSDMKKWIENYQQENKQQFITDAIVDLLSFSIRIKENAINDNSISNRELLESILSHVLLTEKVSRNNMLYNFDLDHYKDEAKKAEVKKLIESFEGKIIGERESILIKK